MVGYEIADSLSRRLGRPCLQQRKNDEEVEGDDEDAGDQEDENDEEDEVGWLGWAGLGLAGLGWAGCLGGRTTGTHFCHWSLLILRILMKDTKNRNISKDVRQK